MTSSPKLTPKFGPVHIVSPLPGTLHTHTAILLHGRGSTGPEFFEELEESPASSGESLTQTFPTWRFVFPSSRLLWSSIFQEDLPAWFEAHSLTNPDERQDLQVGGIRDSVEYINGILEEEVKRLNGKDGNVVLGGISQGGAVGMWMLLCTRRRLGGFFGVSTWLPFANDVERFFSQEGDSADDEGSTILNLEENTREEVNGLEFVRSMMGEAGSLQSTALETPMFLGHGKDDAYVDFSLGQRALEVFNKIMSKDVVWKEYEGAELDGHWLKVPEETDDIVMFLKDVTE